MLQVRVPRSHNADSVSFSIQSVDLRYQLIDLFRRELPGKLGHMTFSVANEIAQLFAGDGCSFFGYERRSSKVPSRSSVPVAFCAVSLVNRIMD
jgi:hypothetical protein